MTEHQWLFVLCNKNTDFAGWWLKLQSEAELIAYLDATNSRYGRAFENYLKDSFYGASVGHGPHIQESGLTLAAYLQGVNRKTSFIDSIVNLAEETATTMLAYIQEYGAIYVNKSGGYNWNPGPNENGDFVRADKIIWPDFSQTDIKISQFPGGRHYYAHIGNTQVSWNGRRRFDSQKDAETAAASYIMKERMTNKS